MRRLASIDIGSLTIRLLVADMEGGVGLTPVFKDRAIIRLGEGVAENGFLNQEAMNRAVSCIADFKHKASLMHSEETYATATACVRAAANRNDFLQAVHNIAGIMPRVLTGDEEARTSLAGVKSVLHDVPPSMIVVDIGGGSTEFTSMLGTGITRAASIPWGVIGLTERFFRHDPPAISEVNALRTWIRSGLRVQGISDTVFTRAEALIGTAGTVTTLAAMDIGLAVYDARKINGYCLTKTSILKLFNELISLPVEARSMLKGLENGRAAVMPAGAAILIEAMDLLRKSTVQVSDAGLLEGILLQKI